MVLVLYELWEAAAAVKLAGNRPPRYRPKESKRKKEKYEKINSKMKA